MKKYTALIIDLKKSRAYSIKYRNSIQEYIMDIIHSLNDIFLKSLVKNVDFSAGDEIQGLFDSAEAAYLYFRMFSMLVSPIEVRAGIGVGNWDVVVEGAGTTAQDGRAYHFARYAIEATEESLGYSVLLYSQSKSDLIINSLLSSTAVIINKQSEYQNELMLLSELIYPITANDIIDYFQLKNLIPIIQSKKRFFEYKYSRMRQIEYRSLFYRINPYELDCRPIDVTYEDSMFFITGGKVRGLASNLSEIIGVSRQSIEKTIKAANIYEARNLAMTTLKYLQMIRRR